MNYRAVIGLLAGVGVLAMLASTTDIAAISRVLVAASWGIVWVVLAHPLASAFSTAGWYVLVAHRSGVTPAYFLMLRWIREGVNALLPVAQVGGDVVRARLIALRGVDINIAAASVTVDLLVEVATQLLFTLLGLAVFFSVTGRDVVASQFGWLLSGTLLAAMAIAGFFLSQRFGLLKLLERSLLKLSEKTGWTSLGGIRGLHAAIVALYRDPRRFGLSATCHLGSWFAGIIETYVAMWALGVGSGGIATALIVESLGQAARSLGFAVPGAVGVQEGGYVLICGAIGIDADQAIALSLVRRIRDIALGLPALLVWRHIERKQSRQRAAAVTAER